MGSAAEASSLVQAGCSPVAAVLVVAAVVLEPQPVRPTPCEQRSALVDSLGHTHMSQHEKFGFYIQKIAFRLTHSA